jgi:hypothetical protein
MLNAEVFLVNKEGEKGDSTIPVQFRRNELAAIALARQGACYEYV